MILFWVFTAIVLLFGFVVVFGAPYVPTLRKELRHAFNELYRVTKNDVIVDLGSGDGTVLKEATKRGAKAYGYELNPVLAGFSRLRLGNAAKIRVANMWRIELPDDTTLVYCFIVSRDVWKLETMLEKEATRLGRPLSVMTFGAGLVRHAPLKRSRAHMLYEIPPLRA